MRGSPAIAYGAVYIGSYDTNLYALTTSSGDELWRFNTGDIIQSSPAVVDGVVYVGSLDKKVYAVTAEQGAELWHFTTGDSIYSAPAVADGTVYIGSRDGKVYALEETAIEVAIDIIPGSSSNPVNPDSRGFITVAILHTDEFDPVARVNVDSLRFGDPADVDPGGGDTSGGAAPAHNGHVEDIDTDGDDDLVLHFPTQDTGFDGDEDRGKLVGETNDGTPLFGTDSVNLVD